MSCFSCFRKPAVTLHKSSSEDIEVEAPVPVIRQPPKAVEASPPPPSTPNPRPHPGSDAVSTANAVYGVDHAADCDSCASSAFASAADASDFMSCASDIADLDDVHIHQHLSGPHNGHNRQHLPATSPAAASASPLRQHSRHRGQEPGTAPHVHLHLHAHAETQQQLQPQLVAQQQHHSSTTPQQSSPHQQHAPPATAAVGSSLQQQHHSSTPAQQQHSPQQHGGPPQQQQQVLQRVAHLYKVEGNVCGAFQVLLQYCRQYGIAADSLKDVLLREYDVDVSRLASAADGVEEMLASLGNDEGWSVARDDVLKLMHKHEAGNSVHGFKARCTLDAPLEQLMCITREFDLAKTWNHYVTESLVLKEWSPAELLALAVLWLPWPLKNANLVVQAVGMELLRERGCFFITFASPRQLPAGVSLPAGTEKNMKIRMAPHSCVEFEPLPPQHPGASVRTRVAIQVFVDAGIRNVPDFLINFVLKVLGPFMFNTVVKLLAKTFKDPSLPLPARMQQRAQLYDWVRQRAQEHVAARQ